MKLLSTFLVSMAGLLAAHSAQAQSVLAPPNLTQQYRLPPANQNRGQVSLATQGKKSDDSWNRKDLQISWSSAMVATHKKAENANSNTLTVFALGFDFEYNLTEYLNLKVSPTASFTNGHIQSETATTSDTRSSSLDLTEASTNAHYQEYITFSAGALNQSHHLSRMTVHPELSFPAARLNLQTGPSKDTYAALFAQAAIPTSASLSTNSEEFERTPQFASGGILGKGNWQPFVTTLRVSAFEYSDLPSSVATASGKTGNSVRASTRAGENSQEFVYDFRGIETNLSLKLEATKKLAFGLTGTFVQNEGAPEDYNRGMLGRADLDLTLGHYKWTPFYTAYRIEPDAVVSYYNDSRLQTNRQGFVAGLSLQYKKIFKVTASGGQKDAIFESSTQVREQVAGLMLETLDAPL